MAKKELTPWFPGGARPARKGWYERKYMFSHGYCYWDGRAWSMGVFELADQDLVRNMVSEEQRLPWRGLAHPPKGA